MKKIIAAVLCCTALLTGCNGGDPVERAENALADAKDAVADARDSKAEQYADAVGGDMDLSGVEYGELPSVQDVMDQ